MNETTFDWKRFHSYRVFDEFLEQFILQRKSYITRHTDDLDLGAAFKDIHQRFVAGYDGSPTKFEDKIANQFDVAPEASKIVPTSNISGRCRWRTSNGRQSVATENDGFQILIY